MKKISRFFTTFLTVVALILHLYGPWASLVATEAKDNWPDCAFNCTANDVSVNKLWLGDASGNPLPSTCTPGATVNASIWAQFYNNANNERNAVILLADLYINGTKIQSIEKCALDSISGKATQDAKLYDFSWICGSQVELKNLVVSWETGSGATCSSAKRECNARGQSKCYSSTGFFVVAPLIADFTYTKGCAGTSTSFFDRTTGGKTPYSYTWDFDNDGNIDSTLQNPTYVYSAPGSYTAKLTVTDVESKTDSQSYSISIESCCGNGTIEIGEQCDDGINNGKYGYCNTECTGQGSYCGDGVLDAEDGEQCDDGNTQDGDRCNSNCQVETCPNLFFSEYIEGSNFNKALEIYNPTGLSVNLNGYKVEIYNNGASNPVYTINLNNVSLASGDVYVLVNSNTYSSELLSKADQTSSNLSFNGDDAIVLKYNSTIIDVIGQIGYDPGEKWGVEPITTKDHTLVRKCGITCGDQNGNDVFDPSIEWDSYNKDDFSHLGEHDPICCICGDGIVNGNEQCDDGNNSNNDACLNDCTNASCGDGYLWFGIEECDGDQPKLCQTENGYLGNQSCNLDCKWGECISFESCGDGIVNGSEQCDEGENNGKTCTPEYGSSCNYCSENCTLETLQGPYCGDGVKNGSEECDGTDGVISGENFCAVNCKLIPIYDGPSTCPEGMVKSQNPIWSGIISATDSDGENINLAIGGKYLLEVSGTFKPTSGNGWWSDAGYTTNNNWLSLATQYGIGGTGSDYAAHALLSDFGSGKVGVVNWGDYNPLHIYTKYYEANNTNWTRFVIGDRYGDWFNTPWQNQTGMFDNQGGLNLNIYACYQVGSISGYAWEDKDGDGNWDTGEPVINGENIPGGLTIFIDLDGDGEQEEGDPQVDIASDGSFLFDNLLPDTYNVCERDDLLSGWIATSPRCQIVNVYEGQNSEINFGNFKLGAIQGRKFEDLNQDGNRDQGEPYLNDWLIRIYKKNGTAWDLLGERITGHTGKQGQYRIEGLTLGKYKICEVLQNSWLQTSPAGVQNREREDEAPRCRLVLITESGQEKTGVSFWNIKKGSISGYKFEDLDKDGEKDENEKGIEGWKICLVSNAQYILSDNLDGEEQSENCVFTDENGYYVFADVIPGTYLVEEETRDGWIATTATSIPIILESGQNYINQNFGNLGLPKFGVTKKNNVAVFVNPNYKVTYTITITNSGFGPAMNFEVKDALPIGFNYVAGTSTITGATGSGPVIDGNTNTLTWLIDWLDAGSSMTITYDVLVLPSVLAGTYTNTVTVEDASAGSSVEVRIPIVAGETIEKEETITETTSTPTKTQPEGKVLGESISTGGSPWTYLLISFLISVALYLAYSRVQLNKRRLVEERENSIQ